MQEEVPPTKRRIIPPQTNIFEGDSADTAACLPIQAVVAGMQNAGSKTTRWEQPQGHPPFFHYEKPKGSAIVEYKTGEKNEVFDDKTTASLW